MAEVNSPPDIAKLRRRREQHYQQIYAAVLYWRGVVNTCRNRLIGAQVQLDTLEAELIRLAPDNAPPKPE